MNYAGRDRETQELNEMAARRTMDARDSYFKAREEYLRLVGWASVRVLQPIGGNETREIIMWVRQHEIDLGKIHRAVSTKLALEEQEELDVY